MHVQFYGGVEPCISPLFFYTVYDDVHHIYIIWDICIYPVASPLINDRNDVHGIALLGGKSSGKTSLICSLLAVLHGKCP